MTVRGPSAGWPVLAVALVLRVSPDEAVLLLSAVAHLARSGRDGGTRLVRRAIVRRHHGVAIVR
jgi:hypothetical protein